MTTLNLQIKSQVDAIYNRESIATLRAAVSMQIYQANSEVRNKKNCETPHNFIISRCQNKMSSTSRLMSSHTSSISAVLRESLKKKSPNFLKPKETYIKAILKSQKTYIKRLPKVKNVYIKTLKIMRKTGLNRFFCRFF